MSTRHPRRRRAARIFASVITVSVGRAPFTTAATIDWTNPAGGTFQVGANWAGGSVPGNADTARFALGNPIHVSLSAAVANDRLVVASGADVTLHASPFNLVVNSDANPGVTVGDVASATPARLELASGNLGAFDIVLGDQAGATGIAHVQSGSWGASRRFIVGNAGDGTFTAALPAFINCGEVDIAAGSASHGFLQIDSSFFGTHSALRIGQRGIGTFRITRQADLGTGPIIVGDEIGAAGTIDLQSNVEWAAGALTVGNFGSGTLLIGTGTMAGGGSASVAQQPGSHGWVNINGGSVHFSQSLNVGGSSTAPGGDGAFSLDAGSISVFGTLRVWDRGRFNWNGGTINVSSIDLVGGGTLAMAAGPNAKLLKTAKVNIDLAHGSMLDLNDNDAQLTNTTRSLVESHVVSARDGGGWTGPGLGSTSARTQPDHATTLGVLQGSEYLAASGTNTFDGSTVAAANVLVKYTWYGDTDFNGRVNFDDYVRIDTGFNNHLSGWLNGDFDLNGTVNFDDYVLIDLAFNVQSGTLSRALAFFQGSADPINAPALELISQHAEAFGEGYTRSFLAAVPEPVGAVMVLSMAPFLVSRRRRRCA